MIKLWMYNQSIYYFIDKRRSVYNCSIYIKSGSFFSLFYIFIIFFFTSQDYEFWIINLIFIIWRKTSNSSCFWHDSGLQILTHAEITAIIALFLMMEILVMSLFAIFSFINFFIILDASLFKEWAKKTSNIWVMWVVCAGNIKTLIELHFNKYNASGHSLLPCPSITMRAFLFLRDLSNFFIYKENQCITCITHTKNRSRVIQPDLLDANHACPLSLNSFNSTGNDCIEFGNIINNGSAVPLAVCAHTSYVWNINIFT